MNSATIQKYLDEVDEVRQGCESLSEIMNSVASDNKTILDGFNNVLDSAIAKCNTADYIIKLYGETLTSSGERLMRTAVDSVKKNYIPVYISERLNERHYGKLQGEDKVRMMRKYGKEQIHLWRRGFWNVPPEGENLRKTFKRAVPFYRRYIRKDLKQGKNVLVVASHNSLRALIKYIEKISNEDIINVEVHYGALLKYEFNKSGLPKNKFFAKLKS